MYYYRVARIDNCFKFSLSPLSFLSIIWLPLLLECLSWRYSIALELIWCTHPKRISILHASQRCGGAPCRFSRGRLTFRTLRLCGCPRHVLPYRGNWSQCCNISIKGGLEFHAQAAAANVALLGSFIDVISCRHGARSQREANPSPVSPQNKKFTHNMFEEMMCVLVDGIAARVRRWCHLFGRVDTSGNPIGPYD